MGQERAAGSKWGETLQGIEDKVCVEEEEEEGRRG